MTPPRLQDSERRLSMHKQVAIVLFVSASSMVLQSGVPGSLRLETLSNVTPQLPTECALVSSPSVRLDGSSVLRGLWGNLPIATNPWTGVEPSILAQIRMHMYGLPRAPDGPPLDRREASRYFLQQADGIQEGYAAFYKDSGAEGVAVYALTYADGQPATVPPSTGQSSGDRAVSWARIGRTVVLAVGSRGACSQGLETYIQSLAPKR